jgi:hypothetical protein
MKAWRGDAEAGKSPAGVPTTPTLPTLKSDAGPVVPASGTSASALPWSKTPKVPVANVATLWRNHIDYLPDQTHNGQMSPGLAGQLFLLGPNDQFAQADGKLTIALYDETPRPPGQPGNIPEGWEFDKKTLQSLRTTDERFGLCYGLFLPWPTYRPDVTRIRIAVRYDPENGHPVYAAESKITLDNTGVGTNVEWSNQLVVPGSRPGGFGPQTVGMTAPTTPATPPVSTGALQLAPPSFGALAPVSAGAFGGPVRPASATGPISPANLPPP